MSDTGRVEHCRRRPTAQRARPRAATEAARKERVRSASAREQSDRALRCHGSAGLRRCCQARLRLRRKPGRGAPKAAGDSDRAPSCGAAGHCPESRLRRTGPLRPGPGLNRCPPGPGLTRCPESRNRNRAARPGAVMRATSLRTCPQVWGLDALVPALAQLHTHTLALLISNKGRHSA